jgi:pumilio RNA-binding family
MCVQKLETVPNEELAAALNEILPRVLVLMNDVFGNFVVQKFFEHGTLEQRQQLADAMKGQVNPYVVPCSLTESGSNPTATSTA